MRNIQTEILIIGGGATGTGVARDLAMRGFKAILVEKGDLTHGTTGRYHGLLHSGGRYVVKDPQAAKECIEENRILRRILPQCIEDTGGFFVLTPWDERAYAHFFVEGCQKAGIPVEEVPISQMLREEPRLNPQISRCFRVPDGSADSFLAADLNAESARLYGATVLPYHEVISLIIDSGRPTADRSKSELEDGGQRSTVSSRNQDGGRPVVGARVRDLIKDEEIEIRADLVVNASGAWAGKVASSAGIQVQIIPGKGTMVAMNHRIVNTVINRCKMPGDGDILVPSHTVAVIGTTDVKVIDPDHYAIEPWEVHLMLEEGEKIVPGFQEMRMLRAWAGVRPLYQETQAKDVRDTREVTRAFVLLDHEQRDGVPGLITITSGKWTTYRKMAEVTADLACTKLGVQRPCRTHLEPLPGAKKQGERRQAHENRLAEVEQADAYGRLVCECELATVDEVRKAIVEGGAATIDDVRRDVRLGMGPCQGGFCTYRVAGMLHDLRHPPVETTNVALRDFLQERWKGLLPVLWGQQLRQERLDELIYLSVLNAPALSGPLASPLAPVPYEPAVAATGPQEQIPEASTSSPVPSPSVTGSPLAVDVLIVGAGIAGLAAAWQAGQYGKRVKVITKGWGANYWNAGCVDVLGYLPGQPKPVKSPAESLPALIHQNPKHPYARVGQETLEAALKAFQEMCVAGGYPMQGSLERNWMLPTALGTLRPTCLAPETMIAGDSIDLGDSKTILIAGFDPFGDFYPSWIASNLSSQGISAEGISLDLPRLREERFVTGRVLAQLFETPEFRAEVADALKPKLGRARRVGLPAVLGLRDPVGVLHDLESQLGLPVFEIPTLPPSIPGIRIHNLLIEAIRKSGGRVFEGMLALSADTQSGRVAAVHTEAASRNPSHAAQTFVLATGGFLGGGLRAGHQGEIEEVLFRLDIHHGAPQSLWFQKQFLADGGHPIYLSGVEVDESFRPLNHEGRAAFQNLYAIGNTLAHGDSILERSLEGIALSTGFAVGNQLAQPSQQKQMR